MTSLEFQTIALAYIKELKKNPKKSKAEENKYRGGAWNLITSLLVRVERNTLNNWLFCSTGDPPGFYIFLLKTFPGLRWHLKVYRKATFSHMSLFAIYPVFDDKVQPCEPTIENVYFP